MRDILNPVRFWIGTSASAQVFGDKRPVALDDTLVILKDSGPLTIDVLANDFDPEGGPLTLISVSAALGTAVSEADNTVTYTPPAGISGFDTILYEIADSLDQRNTGQVNITISDPQLSIIVAPDNTLSVVAEAGLLDLTVTSPASFAGTYQIDTGDLINGPINLVAPKLSGVPEVGQVLSASEGLWVFDTEAGSPGQSWQWRLGGAEIPGAVFDTYTVQAGDIGPGLSVLEIVTDSFGTGIASSAVAGASFQPAADSTLLGWWDANDPTTIIASGPSVSSWMDKAGGVALTQNYGPRQPETGTRTFGGLNAIDFRNGQLLNAIRDLPASGNLAFHMALEVDDIANAFQAILSVDATNDFQIDAASDTQFDGRINVAGIGTTASFTGGPFSGPVILSAVFDYTGTGTITCYVGDALRATTDYTTPIDSNAELLLMTNRSQNAWIDGAVAELVITGDTTNRQEYHTYLSTKWGIA